MHSPNMNPTTNENRYDGTNFFRRIIRLSTRSPWNIYVNVPYTIELTKTVDADLLGGYVIRAHHKEYDRSFEGRFCQLERKLTGR